MVVAVAAAVVVPSVAAVFVVTVRLSRRNILRMWICGTEMLLVPALSSLQFGIPR